MSAFEGRKGVRTPFSGAVWEVGPAGATCSPGPAAAPHARPTLRLHKVARAARCAAGPVVLPRFVAGSLHAAIRPRAPPPASRSEATCPDVVLAPAATSCTSAMPRHAEPSLRAPHYAPHSGTGAGNDHPGLSERI